MHTPAPWEVVEATEHHGFYVTAEWGGTICDLYTMSNPSVPSTRNGGESYPIPHMQGSDEANARLIAASPDLLAALFTFLIEYVRLVESGDAGFWDAEKEPKVIAARAAIARATGAGA